MAAGTLRREVTFFILDTWSTCTCKETEEKTNVLCEDLVLKSFKQIHRTRCYVFQNDDRALDSARKEINDHYKNNKSETDEEKIRELIKFAYDVIQELKTNVIQLKQVQPGRFQAQIRPEMFDDQKKVTRKEKKQREIVEKD